MNQYKAIKVLYTIASQIVFYIIWGIVSESLFSNWIDYRLFFISTVGVFFFEVLILKFNIDDKNKYKTLATIAALTSLSMLLMSFIYSGGLLWLNSLYIITVYSIQYRFYGEFINYHTYKEKIVKTTITLLVLNVIGMIVELNIISHLVKYYVFFLVASIMLLRESRRYTYKIQDKRSNIYSIAIAILMMLMSIDKVYNLVIMGIQKVLDLLNNVVTFILGKILELVIKVISKPLMYFYNMIKSILEEREFDPIGRMKESTGYKNMKDTPIITSTEHMQYMEYFDAAVKIILLIIVAYILYKVIVESKYRRTRGDSFVGEEVEKIRMNHIKKSPFKTLLQKIFKRKGSNKEKICDIHKDFQIRSKIKERYKPSMTSTQLSNINKLHVDKWVELDNIAKIYNEAKFSTHDIENKKVEDMIENYDAIKKDI